VVVDHHLSLSALISIPLLPVSEYPEVDAASVLVSASYPGANPKNQCPRPVATPLEEASTVSRT